MSLDPSITNERGIQCLRHRQYRDAAAYFAQGLRQVKLALASVDENPCCVCCCSEPSPLKATNENAYSSHTCDAPSFRPMKISASMCRCGCTACNSKLVFVFIFNTALTFHLSALTLEKNSRSLQKALGLYEMAEDLSRQGTFPVSLAEFLVLRQHVSHAKRIRAFTNGGEDPALWHGFLSVFLNLCAFFQEDHSAPAA